MKKYTIGELQFEFKKLGYQWFDFMIVGIRSTLDKPNEFDDLIGLVANGKVIWFTGTTNPGTHWLKNIMNPKGTAVLKPGQYIDTWAFGLHQGKYEALKQVKPVTVYRDKDLDDKSEETAVTDTGLFGINIHRANEKAISKIIDKWSAGCQVLNNPADFKTLLDSCKESKLKAFTYTLLKEF
jgi:hypothetical protein